MLATNLRQTRQTSVGPIMKKHIRVLSIDDHPLMREGIAQVINLQPDMRIVAQVSSGREALSSFREHQPDIALMDLRLPDMNGIDAMTAIKAEFPEARIIILTTFDGDIEIQRALAAGAHSYVLKSMPPEELAETVRQVYRGGKRISPQIAAQLAEHLSEIPLSEREMDVLRRVMTGNRNRDIALDLCVTEETVKSHMKRIMEKLGATDRTQAVTIALRRGFLEL